MNSLWSVTLKWILGIRNLINNGQQWMAGIQTPVTISHDYSPTLSGSGGGFLGIRGDLGEGKVSIEDAIRGEKERCYSLSERRSQPAGEDIESAYSPYCFQHIS